MVVVDTAEVLAMNRWIDSSFVAKTNRHRSSCLKKRTPVELLDLQAIVKAELDQRRMEGVG